MARSMLSYSPIEADQLGDLVLVLLQAPVQPRAGG
jgi:hypothetical protein